MKQKTPILAIGFVIMLVIALFLGINLIGKINNEGKNNARLTVIDDNLGKAYNYS
jgi:hypothetical protein